jgi:hypothetical protein
MLFLRATEAPRLMVTTFTRDDTQALLGTPMANASATS